MQVVIHQWGKEGSFDRLAKLPRQEMSADWHGCTVDPPAEFAFAVDDVSLWYLAARRSRAFPHPNAMPGAFMPELWRYDAAEWFMAAHDSDEYWEFNLAPTGAWWACAFRGVRNPDPSIEAPVHVETTALCIDGGWCAMARVPLKELRGGDWLTSRMAAAFILESPRQIFLTTATDVSGEPDFHRPETFEFPVMNLCND